MGPPILAGALACLENALIVNASAHRRADARRRAPRRTPGGPEGCHRRSLCVEAHRRHTRLGTVLAGQAHPRQDAASGRRRPQLVDSKPSPPGRPAREPAMSSGPRQLSRSRVGPSVGYGSRLRSQAERFGLWRRRPRRSRMPRAMPRCVRAKGHGRPCRHDAWRLRGGRHGSALGRVSGEGGEATTGKRYPRPP